MVRDFLRERGRRRPGVSAERFLKPDLLILDDMSMKQLPERSGEYLFEIVMRPYETRSTVINRPLEDWGKLIGDVPRRDGDPGPLPATTPESSPLPPSATACGTRRTPHRLPKTAQKGPCAHRRERQTEGPGDCRRDTTSVASEAPATCQS